MPVLPPELNIYPDELFEDVCYLSETSCWFALHTKPRAEKKLARALLRWQIPFYLPLWVKWSRRQGRDVPSYLPLFPSYVFVVATDGQRIQIDRTGLVADFLEPPDRDELVGDLRALKKILEAAVPFHLHQYLAAGKLVRVQEGVLAGMDGYAISHGEEHHVFFPVGFVKQGVSIAVPVEHVLPLVA